MVVGLKTGFTLSNCWYGLAGLPNNGDPDKYKYSGYGTGFDSWSVLSLTDGSMGKKVTIFGADMSLSVYIDNKKQRYMNSLVKDQHKY